MPYRAKLSVRDASSTAVKIMANGDKKSDLIWGATTIAKAINRSRRQTFHLLEQGHLPAKKIGARWVASRAALQQFFASNGETDGAK